MGYTGREEYHDSGPVKKEEMAVKKHELVSKKSNLGSLVQALSNHQSYILTLSFQELIKYCINVVKCLAGTNTTVETEPRSVVAEQLVPVEVFLQNISTSLSEERREKFITAILEAFYTIISDPHTEASPAASIILSVFRDDPIANTIILKIFTIDKDDQAHINALKTSLYRLYQWLTNWACSTYITEWVLGFMKSLEEMGYIDILIDVSLLHIDGMLDTLADPTSPIQQLAPVVVRILASIRELPDIMSKISRKVCDVLDSLTNDSNQWARQILQDTVDVVSFIIEKQLQPLNQEQQDQYKEQHAEIISCLARHMASSWNKFLDIDPWHLREETDNDMSIPTEEYRKVGLKNLGNTCYVNSIMQALLLTRQFSNHSMRHMCSIPFWSKMSMLFAKLNYSKSNKVNPEDFFNLVKPSYFNKNQQQDSSEFLVFLLDLLQRYEHSNENADVVERRKLSSARSSSSGSCDSSSSSSSSSSPKPSGSKSSSSSTSSNKRSSTSSDGGPPRKRFCSSPSPSSSPKVSYIQTTFSGTMLTITKCSNCNTSSHNRDLFRDLQLGFPEKAESGQHSVQSLLEYYCSPELLTGDNRYQCPNCNVLRDAQRSVVIDLAPKYLIIVLKRFKYEPKLQLQTKLMHKVYHNHKIYLPTGSKQPERTVYDLYATVIHSGTTLDAGHYYTIGNDNGQWYSFNDDVVQPCTEDDLNSLGRPCTPYMLFYRRSDIEEEATVPLQEELPPRITDCLQAHNKISKARRITRHERSLQ